ncbi:Rrf2 family transcriptional regulator [Azonexus sp. R2A61]|uniref:Rrf2 family transcriptional regulator n=1 Tax=Azonexus sp. R2A61 TaxID=2744443 RepID=UPI001F26209A|nr:Rrf2 family transcriptional regulator [Azonexus sp. R2A61]
MRLTTKGRFAVTAMMDLALRGEGGPVALASIADRQNISLSYLEQLFGKLRRYKLVDSVRGPGGGYCISRPLDKVSVAEIIRAVDEQLDATQCGGNENCHGVEPCMTHELWSTLNAKMFEYLASVSLSDLIEREQQKAAARGESIIVDQRPAGPSPRRVIRDKVAAVA